MSDDDVYRFGMDDQPTFDDPSLRDLRGDARVAYEAPALSASPALVAIFESGAIVPTDTPRSWTVRRRFAQLATATVAVVAATSGLAIAGALPASVRGVFSNDDDTVEAADEGEPAEVPLDDLDPTTTTTAEPDTSTTLPLTTTTLAPGEDGAGEHPDNHGGEVSEVARDDSLHGCEHGRAVSEVASGKVHDKPCPHSTTTSTSVPDGDAADEPEADEDEDDDDDGPGNSNGHGNGNGHGRGNSNGNGNGNGHDRDDD